MRSEFKHIGENRHLLSSSLNYGECTKLTSFIHLGRKIYTGVIKIFQAKHMKKERSFSFPKASFKGRTQSSWFSRHRHFISNARNLESVNCPKDTVSCLR
jgi:hypothetical protein